MEALGAGSARGHPAKAGSGQGIRHATAPAPRVWSTQGVWPELLLDQAKLTPQPSGSSVSVPRGHRAHLVHLNHSTANAGTSSLSR